VFLARIHRTTFHTKTKKLKERLLRERSVHRQHDARRALLHETAGFDKAAMRIAPAAHNRELVLENHRDQFGVHLTENTHTLLTAPNIHLPILFP
jgi:hypothetical protein